MKKCFSLILLLCMLTAFVPVAVNAEIRHSGMCGEHLTWTLDSDGTLTITGYGEMDSCDYWLGRPWHKLEGEPSHAYSSLIKKVVVSGNVTDIGDYAFYGFRALESVSLPDSIEKIGKSAFWNCEKLTSIQIPKDVNIIGDGAFSACKGITELIIPDGVTEMGSLNGCTNLKNISIPDSVNKLGLIQKCDALESLRLPGGLDTIDELNLWTCKNLKSVTIGNGTRVIGQRTFWNCQNLETINISQSVEDFNSYTLQGCNRLKNINVDANNKNYCSADGVLFNKTKSEIIRYPEGKTDTAYSLPNSVIKIGDIAFKDCKNLKSIQIPKNVNTIGHSAFDTCKSITDITIPNGVTTIERRTFAECSSLTNITMPNTLNTIESVAFSFCDNLKNVYFNGTKEEWESISIGNGSDEIGGDNTALDNAKKHFRGVPDILGTPTVTVNNNKYTFSISLNNVEYDSSLITVLYKDNVMVKVSVTPLSAGDTEKLVTMNADGADNARVLIWNGLWHMNPLCEAKEVSIK